MADKGIAYVSFVDEVSHLRYIIAKYKGYDRKRKKYIAGLERTIEQLSDKVKRLETLTEHQHEEIDELIDAYSGAKPLMIDKSQKAWIYELIKRAKDGSKLITKCNNLAEMSKILQDENKRLRERNKALEEKVEDLEAIIKSLHNGTKQTNNHVH